MRLCATRVTSSSNPVTLIARRLLSQPESEISLGLGDDLTHAGNPFATTDGDTAGIIERCISDDPIATWTKASSNFVCLSAASWA